MVYKIEREQWINIPIEKAWEFFSSPNNLSEITPKSMGFIIKNNPPKDMYEGLIIAYTVKPLMGIPMTWVTEITHVKPMEYFVDEQRKGPYKMWHHEHFFESKDGGTLMRDVVHYILPMGILGKIAHPILVKKKLKKIFDYRIEVLEQKFNSTS